MLSTDQYTIINANTADLSEIKAINSKLEYDRWSEENFQNAFNWNLPIHIIQNKQGKTVGYLISLFCLEEIKIVNFMIDPDYQRQGYGRALMLHVLHEAVLQGIQYAMLDVRTTNVGAINLYTSLGFCIISTRPNYYTDQVVCDAYLLQLRLR